MDVTLTTLKPTAPISNIAERQDECESRAIMVQLRQITDHRATAERRVNEGKHAPVDFAGIVTAGAAKILLVLDPNKLVLQIPESVFVRGPADDLVDLIASLLDYGQTVGPEPIRLRTQINYTCGELVTTCTTELLVESSEVPDFLQRKILDTVRARGGEVTTAAAAIGHRISFTLPVDRRSGTILG